MRASHVQPTVLILLLIAAGCGDTSGEDRQSRGGSNKLLDAAMNVQRTAPAAPTGGVTAAPASTAAALSSDRTRPTARNIGGIMDTSSTLSETGFGGGRPAGPVTASPPPPGGAGPGGGAPAAGAQGTGSQSGSILHRTTRDVADAQAQRKAGARKADTKVPVGDPITVSMSVYGTARFRAAQIQIQSGLQAYYAEEGGYPRNYDEFKRGVLDRYNLELPALPDYQRYGYDAQKRELIILEYPELKQNRGR